jgi:hypothetical protein
MQRRALTTINPILRIPNENETELSNLSQISIDADWSELTD